MSSRDGKPVIVPVAVEPADDPPVVARMVVEIRSDGSRTVARGAMVDLVNGSETAIEARGTTPAQLAFALARELMKMPRLMAKSSLRALLPGRGSDKPNKKLR